MMIIIGIVLFLSSMLAMIITASRQAKYQQELGKYLKENEPELWINLGKPELSFFRPFRSIPMIELVAKSAPQFENNSKLLVLHSKAKFWFYMYGANFALVFISAVIIVAGK